MKNSFFFILACIALSAALTIFVCGCGRAYVPEEHAAPVMTEVYDDGSYTVDAGDIIHITDSEGLDLPLVRLHIANRTERPLVISTSLCVKASDGVNTLPCSVPPGTNTSGTDVYNAIDGRVAPGGYTDGYIALPSRFSGDQPVTITITTDYCGEKSISFALKLYTEN